MTHAQLIGLGFGPDAIKYRLRVGRLFRQHRGVYAVGRPAASALERAAAAVLACGETALLSHLSALALWGLHEWTRTMHVSVTTDRRHCGIVVHLVSLARKDVRREKGIRVTSPARTLLDCAPLLSDRALKRAVNEALHALKIVKLHELSEVLARRGAAKGAAKLRAAANLAAENPTRSALEDDAVLWFQRHGLPTPQTNVKVNGHLADIYLPEADLIIEIDSWDFHRSRDAFERDRERDATALLAGTATVRITSRRMKQDGGAREAERLKAIIEARTRLRAAAPPPPAA